MVNFLKQGLAGRERFLEFLLPLLQNALQFVFPRDVADRSKENTVFILRDQLQMHGDIVQASVFSLVHGLKDNITRSTLKQRPDFFPELLLVELRFDVPRSKIAQFLEPVTQVFSRPPIDQEKLEGSGGKQENFARRIFDDQAKLGSVDKGSVPLGH